MLWLQTPPWAKWFAVGLVSLTALWLEVRPEPQVDHLFAIEDIAPGESIGPDNTETRTVPAGLLDPPPADAHAVEPIPAGTPVLAAYATNGPRTIQDGWWIVSAPIPTGAAVGDQVKVVMMDTATAVDGVVAAVPFSDAFSSSEGSIAVPEQDAAEVAIAAANGRVTVLVSGG